MKTYSIGQVAKLTSLPTKTIRFYEDAGLITPPARADNTYRLYNLQIIQELQLVKSARDLGLSISEIKKLMLGCTDGACCHTENYLQTIITNHLSTISEKISELTSLQTKFENLKHSHTNCCDLLHQLTTSTIERR